MLKSAVHRILVFLAQRRLRRSGAHVIGITGSIGKTTVKEAVYATLKKEYKVLKSAGNFNTEFGLPMSILQINSIPNSPLMWIWSVILAFFRTYFCRFSYDYLVLEYGIDSPGDMDVLTSIAQPHIVIFTQIGMVHMEKGQFRSLKSIWKEKSKIIDSIPVDGLVIFNAEDPLQKSSMKHFDRCQSIACGMNGRSYVEADHIKESARGLDFVINCDGKAHHVSMPHIVGRYHVSLGCILFALHTRLARIRPITVTSALSHFRLPPGRMNVLHGIKRSTIIDSSYNASPASMHGALDTLSRFSGRKIAALGQMNELGTHSQKAHEEVGRKVAKVADILVTVGKLGRIYARTAIKHVKGKSIQIYSFDTSLEAGKFLKDLLKPKDVILVKGSQNKIRMEILIKEIMRDRHMARSLLVRQSKKWLQ